MKIISVLTAAVLTLAPAAFAQDLPQYNADTGFEVTGTLGGNILVVNGGYNFVCGFEDGDNWATLTDCRPLLGAEPGPLPLERNPELQARVDDTTSQLNSLDASFTSMAIRSFFASNNCMADITDMDRLQAEMMAHVASEFALDADVIPHVESPLYEAIDGAMESMLGSGTIAVNRARTAVVYEGC